MVEKNNEPVLYYESIRTFSFDYAYVILLISLTSYVLILFTYDYVSASLLNINFTSFLIIMALLLLINALLILHRKLKLTLRRDAIYIQAGFFKKAFSINNIQNVEVYSYRLKDLFRGIFPAYWSANFSHGLLINYLDKDHTYKLFFSTCYPQDLFNLIQSLINVKH